MLEKNLEQMNLMKFFGMAIAYQAAIQGKQSFTNDELVSMLVQAEWEDREDRKIRRHLKAARFRYHAAVEEITYDPGRNLDKTIMTRLTDCGSSMPKRLPSTMSAMMSSCCSVRNGI